MPMVRGAAGLVVEAPMVVSGSGVGKPTKLLLACATKGERQQWLDCFGSHDAREDEAQVRKKRRPWKTMGACPPRL